MQDNKAKTWKKYGKEKEHGTAVVKMAKKESLKLMYDFVTHKMEQGDITGVLAEIEFLSNTMRSCLVTVNNKTRIPVQYDKCLITRGREASSSGFDADIPPQSKGSYSFEKYTRHSIEGCAAMMFFSIASKPNACLFMVAFRNYTIKIMRPNRAVLMFLDSKKSMDKVSDLKVFEKIMNNKGNSRNIPGCYEGKKILCANLGSTMAGNFDSIEFSIEMNNDNYCSEVNVIVSQQF